MKILGSKVTQCDLYISPVVTEENSITMLKFYAEIIKHEL